MKLSCHFKITSDSILGFNSKWEVKVLAGEGYSLNCFLERSLQLPCGEWIIEGLERKEKDRELLHSSDKRWWYLVVVG